MRLPDVMMKLCSISCICWSNGLTVSNLCLLNNNKKYIFTIVQERSIEFTTHSSSTNSYPQWSVINHTKQQHATLLWQAGLNCILGTPTFTSYKGIPWQKFFFNITHIMTYYWIIWFHKRCDNGQIDLR